MFPFSNPLVVIPVVQEISGRRPDRVVVAVSRRPVGVVVGGIAAGLRRNRFRRRAVSPLKLVLRRGPEAPNLSLEVFEHSTDRLKPDDLSPLSGAILDKQGSLSFRV